MDLSLFNDGELNCNRERVVCPKFGHPIQKILTFFKGKIILQKNSCTSSFEIVSAFEWNGYRNMPTAATSAKFYNSELRTECPNLFYANLDFTGRLLSIRIKRGEKDLLSERRICCLRRRICCLREEFVV